MGRNDQVRTAQHRWKPCADIICSPAPVLPDLRGAAGLQQADEVRSDGALGSSQNTPGERKITRNAACSLSSDHRVTVSGNQRKKRSSPVRAHTVKETTQQALSLAL